MKKFLYIDSQDNVAVALMELASGTEIDLMQGKIVLNQLIPMGHKFALENIEQGQLITKYGETIGKAIQTIKRGDHVHTHNLESLRGRGDQEL